MALRLASRRHTVSAALSNGPPALDLGVDSRFRRLSTYLRRRLRQTLRVSLSRGLPIVASLCLVTGWVDMGQEYTLLVGTTTPPFKVTLTLFGKLPTRHEDRN